MQRKRYSPPARCQNVAASSGFHREQQQNKYPRSDSPIPSHGRENGQELPFLTRNRLPLPRALCKAPDNFRGRKEFDGVSVCVVIFFELYANNIV